MSENRYLELVASIDDEIKSDVLAQVVEDHESDPDEYPATDLLTGTSLLGDTDEDKQSEYDGAVSIIEQARGFNDPKLLTNEEADSLIEAVGASWTGVERDEHGWPVGTTIEQRMAFNKVLVFLQEAAFIKMLMGLGMRAPRPDTDEDDN